MNFLRLAVVFALLAMAAAFVPAPARLVRSAPLQMGYVPDGISAADYDKLKKKEAAAAAANKKKFKNKPFETLGDWLIQREKKFPNAPGAGHRFVKLKYEMDKEENFTRNKPRAADGL